MKMLSAVILGAGLIVSVTAFAHGPCTEQLKNNCSTAQCAQKEGTKPPAICRACEACSYPTAPAPAAPAEAL